MVDNLDPRLESTLRTVLRGEANALPFTLRAAALERTRSERVRARRAQRWAAAATAVAVIVVGGAALVAALRPAGPAASPGDNLSGLPSFERLAGAGTGGGPPLLQLEEAAGSQAREWRYALPRGAYPFQYLVGCSGSAPVVVSLSADSLPATEIGAVTCDGGIWRLAWDGTDEQAILSAASVSLLVQAQPGTSWRMLVADDGSGRVVQRFDGSSRLFRLPSFDWIVQQRSAGATEIVRGSGLNPAATGSAVATLRGTGTATGIEVLLACVGSPVEVSFAAAGSATAAAASGPLTCDGTKQDVMWGRTAAIRSVSEVRLVVPAGTAWGAIVWDISSNPPLTPQSQALP